MSDHDRDHDREASIRTGCLLTKQTTGTQIFTSLLLSSDTLIISVCAEYESLTTSMGLCWPFDPYDNIRYALRRLYAFFTKVRNFSLADSYHY